MTPFGANDSAISQTKCFSTLMSLRVFHRNKKKKLREVHESALFLKVLLYFSGFVGKEHTFLSCFPLNLTILFYFLIFPAL